MMTPAQLERGSDAFRRGYRAAENEACPYPEGTFGAYDWNEGRSAARADRRPIQGRAR